MESTTNESGSTTTSTSTVDLLNAEDAYLLEYMRRRDGEIIGPLDRANSAFVRAEQATAIFGEQADECDRALLLTQLAAVAEAARITAVFMRRSTEDRDTDYHRAEAMSHHTVSLANRVDEFDLERLEGLKREREHEMARGAFGMRTA